jgi:uncharacterized membrane protein YkoI
MTIKNSVLTLAMATAMAGGALVLTAPTPAHAADLASTGSAAPAATSDDAKEDAKDANHEATEMAGEAPATGVSAQSINDQLKAAGYTDIDDVEMEDGVWTAEAKGPDGKKVELKLDPTDGHIISTKND